MPGIGPWEIGIIMLLALVVFGPGKLPEVGKYVGKTVKSLKSALDEAKSTVDIEPESEKKSKKNNN